MNLVIWKRTKCVSFMYQVCNFHHHPVRLQQKLISETEIFKKFPKELKPVEYELSVMEEWKTLNSSKTIDDSSKYISMLLPPPNVTGNLHLGHVITVSIQDVMARWYHMNGYKVIWIPGTDHAGIATQVVVEKLLSQEGKTKYDLGREEFLNKIKQYQLSKGDHIIDQLKNMGTTLDWSRAYFTMDEHQCYAVKEAIIRLFEDGLIYRNDSLVNWCCQLKSTISDIEVNYIHVEGKTEINVPGYDEPVSFGQLYDIAYKINDSNDEIIVSTTRPETILGDVAIAVNPNDERYKHLKDKFVIHPFDNRLLPIVFDDAIDKEFGTGAVKITPGHDKTDFDIGKRHGLPILNILNEEGLMNENCKEYNGMKRFDVRDKVIDKLNEIGLLRNIKDHTMAIPTCSRTNDVIELIIKDQWFINCKEMSNQILDHTKNENISIDPELHQSSWNIWFNNIQDWCISRQIWWGHQIPLYKCKHGWIAAHNIDEAKQKAKEKWNDSNIDLIQDTDVLDTWFSSALLPFSTLGWPNQTDSNEYKKLYPLTLMETGYDILCFWVARMSMLGLYLTKQLPFNKIYLHGMVCDGRGRKMSKSLGNTIEPEHIVKGISLKDLNKTIKKNYELGTLSKEELEINLNTQRTLFPEGIPECGTDALRYTLCLQNIKSLIISFDLSNCEINKRFGFKLLNLTKFICCNSELLNINEIQTSNQLTALSFQEQWILSRLANTIDIINNNLVNLDIHIAARSLKTFLYGDFCDIFIEICKPLLNSNDEDVRKSVGNTLLTTLDASLRMTSPFMPFVIHILYKFLPNKTQHFVSECSYPQYTEWKQWINPQLEEEIEVVIDVVKALRKITIANNISSKVADAVIISEKHIILRKYISVIESLVRCKSILIGSQKSILKEQNVFNFADTVDTHTSVHIIIENYEKNVTQHEKLMKDKKDRLKKDIEKVMKRMYTKDGDKKRLPDHIQEGIDNRLNSLHKELSRVQTFLDLAKDATKQRHANDEKSS